MAYKQLKLWFDKDLAKLLSNKILEVETSFDSKIFISKVEKNVDALELKDRVELIADKLHQTLEKPYPESLAILSQILGPENEEETGMFANFYWVMPIAKYVEKYGLADFDISMEAIKEITKRNTGEYTIRPFIEEYPDRTLETMLSWSLNENKHVRRLASEGGRPRLPWAPKLTMFVEDPTPLIPILENLKDDTSKYVQKSVANCINDILKDNLEPGKRLIESWASNPTRERNWIIKHALRNLLKKKDSWAISILA